MSQLALRQDAEPPQLEPCPLDLPLHYTQGVALQTLATEVLFGGAAGGGKSHYIRAAAIQWATIIPNLQVYIFRRLSDDLQKNHMEGVSGFPALLAEWVANKICKITYNPTVVTFWNGSKIHLAHCQYEKNLTSYQGAEIHLLLVDELTHFTEAMYRYLRSRVRLGGLVVPPEFKGMFPRIACGTNPGGVGHTWVKRSFVDSAPPLEIVRQIKAEGGMLRQFIPSKLIDNPTMDENDPDYMDRLLGLGSAALVKAMADGDWNIVAGGAFDDVWNAEKCVLPQFVIPSSWRIDRAFDWGSAHPFSVGWWAEADGTEAKIKQLDGTVRVFCPPKGSLIQIAEWYGAEPGKTNTGIKAGSTDIALGVVKIEKEMKAAGQIKRNVLAGPADNQIDNVIDSQTPTIAKKMAGKGVLWTKSDKSPGSRIIGFELVRGMVREAAKDRPIEPGMWIMETCRNTIAQIPVLPRDPKNIEDVDTKSEDHVYDMVRYRALATKQTLTKLRIGGF